MPGLAWMAGSESMGLATKGSASWPGLASFVSTQQAQPLVSWVAEGLDPVGSAFSWLGGMPALIQQALPRRARKRKRKEIGLKSKGWPLVQGAGH